MPSPWRRLRDWWLADALPSEDQLNWLMEATGWLLDVAPASTTMVTARPLLPTEDDFPLGGRDADAFVRQLFTLIKGHAAMGQWPCQLLLMDETERPEKIMGVAAGRFSHTDTNGWFRSAPGEPTRIAVRRQLATDWEKLVAVLAHELGHYRLAPVERPPPGGWERREAVTDLCAVAMGFGVFVANTAVRVEQYQGLGVHGWRMQGTAKGYLGERERAAALALSVAITGAEPAPVRRHLHATPRRTFDVTRRWLAEHHPRWGPSLRERHGRFDWS